jgi:hypothetical protein
MRTVALTEQNIQLVSVLSGLSEALLDTSYREASSRGEACYVIVEEE